MNIDSNHIFTPERGRRPAKSFLKIYGIGLLTLFFIAVLYFLFATNSLLPKSSQRVNISLLGPSSSAIVLESGPLKANNLSTFSILSVLPLFHLKSPDFILAQIGGTTFPDSFYTSVEMLQEHFSHLLTSIKSRPSSLSPLSADEDLLNPVGPDAPFHKFACSFENTEKKPVIAIVLLGFGGQEKITQQALHSLPPEMTFGYFSYGEDLSLQIEAGRKAGHEILVMVPMEPLYYPENDPGASTLLTGIPFEENLKRLQEHLKNAVGTIGITNFLGSRFVLSSKDLMPVIKELHQKGFMIFDSSRVPRSLISEMAQANNLPFAHADIHIDEILERSAIDVKLHLLEEKALKEGKAIGFGFCYPLTIDILATWAQRLQQRGILLAPLSSIALSTSNNHENNS